MEVGLSPGQWQRCTALQFSAHVCCGQTAEWVKMPLGMEVGLGPGHIVLDGDPVPQKRGHSPPPNFQPMSVVANNGWMDQDTWYGGMPRPRPHCVRWGPISPPKKGHSPPLFGPCLLLPNGWMDQDATLIGAKVGLGLGYIVTWDPAPKATQPPIFGPCILWRNGRPSQLLLLHEHLYKRSPKNHARVIFHACSRAPPLGRLL